MPGLTARSLAVPATSCSSDTGVTCRVVRHCGRVEGVAGDSEFSDNSQRERNTSYRMSSNGSSIRESLSRIYNKPFIGK